jgi:GR25 family glycosyltransferase involved in LPS biosynthesis
MSFNWIVYKELNPDLEKAGLTTIDEFKRHYLIHGHREKRNISIYNEYPNFEPNMYKTLNSDLQHMNTQELEIHYLVYGRHENRNISIYNEYPYFKPDTYKSLNSDLQHMNKEELEIHWLVYGRYEKRNYINIDYIQGIDKIYWINLERSVDRMNHMKNIFSILDIENERVIASDGNNDNNMMNQIVVNSVNRSLGEYGCLLSHLRAIQTFWNSNLDRVIIMEDDVSLDFACYWNKSIRTIMSEAPPDWEILMLSYTDTSVNSESPLYREWSCGIYSTVAYLINRKGADNIMKMYKDNKWHIDISPHVADYVIYQKCKTYVYKYSYFTTNDLGGSNIHENHLEIHEYTKRHALGIWEN